MRSPSLLASLALSLVLPAAQARPPAPAGVATADPRATQAALRVLQDGGSAADAAVTAALVLAVAHPQAGNLAGGGFALVLDANEAHALDFREVAPAAARRDTYLDERGEPVPGASTLGPLAAGVPGTPGGLFELHRRFGRLPWARVVRPAASLADRGFAVGERLSADLAARSLLLARFPESRAAWLPEGLVPPAGERVRLPELARNLRRYARRGPEGLLTGRPARELVAASQAHGGILTLDDLAAVQPVWREPVLFAVGDWQVASMPLPSSGGIILAQSLELLRAFPPPPAHRDAVAGTHRLVEAWRRAYADRAALGDPDTGLSATAEQLLAHDWIAARAASFDPRRATPSEWLEPWPGAGLESEDTTHLSVADADGGAVALTTTLNATFGGKLWVPGWGFLNNEMDDFTTAPGRPNLYGLVQGPANEVRPGRRMLSSMSPTVAWRRDEVLALGSPGGSRIPTAVFQVLTRALGGGRTLQEAIDSPRVHHQWKPDRIDFEPGALDAAALAALEALGHRLNERPGHGEVHAVRRHPSLRVEAAADPRGPGAAATASRAGVEGTR